MVLACTGEDTTGIDVASGAFVRVRVPWPEGHAPDLSPFDMVEAELAPDPERDDLAQPEAVTAGALPRLVGTLRGFRARRLLAGLVARPDGPLLGFPGASAPYWGFRGLRPSVALLHPERGPQLLQRPADGSTWIRFGWERDDVWLPVEDQEACRALVASRRERLTGKTLESALGFSPYYVLATVSRPREGHCYKVCAAAVAPRLTNVAGRPGAAGAAGSAEIRPASQVLGHRPAERHQPVAPAQVEPGEQGVGTLGHLWPSGARSPGRRWRAPSPCTTKVRSSTRPSAPKRLARRRAQARSSPVARLPAIGTTSVRPEKARKPSAHTSRVPSSTSSSGKGQAGPDGTGRPSST